MNGGNGENKEFFYFKAIIKILIMFLFLFFSDCTFDLVCIKCLFVKVSKFQRSKISLKIETILPETNTD